ncbi:PREDICTED: mucin-5AC-like [Priapulus caudatus]|uniref:Mucin-5AC-like n=1 Tax=Priapulus caudatus TaxID=37621 RepID=A0ABM1DPA7_PRICU|nr:PREDICTED: mucin-5AC-like [Priapulus caudatus]
MAHQEMQGPGILQNAPPSPTGERPSTEIVARTETTRFVVCDTSTNNSYTTTSRSNDSTSSIMVGSTANSLPSQQVSSRISHGATVAVTQPLASSSSSHVPFTVTVPFTAGNGKSAMRTITAHIVKTTDGYYKLVQSRDRGYVQSMAGRFLTVLTTSPSNRTRADGSTSTSSKPTKQIGSSLLAIRSSTCVPTGGKAATGSNIAARLSLTTTSEQCPNASRSGEPTSSASELVSAARTACNATMVHRKPTAFSTHEQCRDARSLDSADSSLADGWRHLQQLEAMRTESRFHAIECKRSTDNNVGATTTTCGVYNRNIISPATKVSRVIRSDGQHQRIIYPDLPRLAVRTSDKHRAIIRCAAAPAVNDDVNRERSSSARRRCVTPSFDMPGVLKCVQQSAESILDILKPESDDDADLVVGDAEDASQPPPPPPPPSVPSFTPPAEPTSLTEDERAIEALLKVEFNQTIDPQPSGAPVFDVNHTPTKKRIALSSQLTQKKKRRTSTSTASKTSALHAHTSDDTSSSCSLAGDLNPETLDIAIGETLPVLLNSWNRYLQATADEMMAAELENAQSYRYNNDAIAMVSAGHDASVWDMINNMRLTFPQFANGHLFNMY